MTNQPPKKTNPYLFTALALTVLALSALIVITIADNDRASRRYTDEFRHVTE